MFGKVAVPYVLSTLAREMQRNITVGALVVGAVIVAYVFTRSPRAVSYGLITVGIGYGLLAVGTKREYWGAATS
jgi:hypothetical protein